MSTLTAAQGIQWTDLTVPGGLSIGQAEAIKKGMLYFTEEEPLDLPGDPLHGFIFTPMVYITAEGRAALAAAQ